MDKILAVDYGLKRTGFAYAEKPLNIAMGLCTVPTNEIYVFLDNYLKDNTVVKIIIGEPKSLNGKETNASEIVKNFHKKITKKYNYISIELYDERFTSKMAKSIMIASGINKNKRKNKDTVDKISAIIILQDYLKSIEI